MNKNKNQERTNTKFPKTLKIKKDNGDFIYLTYFRNLKELKTEEKYCQYTKTKKVNKDDYSEYLNEITKIEMEPNLQKARQEVIEQQKMYKEAISKLYIDHYSVCAYEPQGDLDLTYDEQEYFTKYGEDFASRMWIEHDNAIKNFNKKINLYNFIAGQIGVKFNERPSERVIDKKEDRSI